MRFRLQQAISITGISIFLFFGNVCAENVSISAPGKDTSKTTVNTEPESETAVDQKVDQQSEGKPSNVVLNKKRPRDAKLLHADVSSDVPISTTEINRISSDDEIKSIKYNKQVASLVVTYKGTNAYFLYPGKTEVLAYIETESNVYPVRLIPTEMKAAHYILSSDDEVSGKKEHQAGDRNLSKNIHSTNKEKRLIEMLKYVYTNPPIEDGPVEIIRVKKHPFSSELEIYKYRTYSFDEDGISINVYLAKLSNKCTKDEITLSEKDFLIPEIVNSPVGISLEHNVINKERYTRVFVLGASKAGRG